MMADDETAIDERDVAICGELSGALLQLMLGMLPQRERRVSGHDRHCWAIADAASIRYFIGGAIAPR